MKRFLLAFSFLIASLSMSAQCTEIFISEYVEAVGNNRAFELYNPTATAVQLSGYSIARFDNGNTTALALQLPARLIAPYSTVVVVLDKRDPNGSNLEIPVFNGFEIVDTCRNRATQQPLIDSVSGRFRICAQYDSVAKKYTRGATYRAYMDLACRADIFLNPTYNGPMYYNGNDALVLFRGTTVAVDYSNVVDCVGVIGENPGFGWRDLNGVNLTEDRTLVRKRNIRTGSGARIALRSDTFRYSEWTAYPTNTFTFLKAHISDCAPTNPATAEKAACPPSGIETVKEVNATVYPNPLANRMLTIESPENLREIEVYNMLGELMKFQKVTGESRSTSVEMPALPKGMYIVQLKFENDGIASRKLIVE
jgi:hypothetical protein